jgi:hypothetical protein
MPCDPPASPRSLLYGMPSAPLTPDGHSPGTPAVTACSVHAASTQICLTARVQCAAYSAHAACNALYGNTPASASALCDLLSTCCLQRLQMVWWSHLPARMQHAVYSANADCHLALACIPACHHACCVQHAQHMLCWVHAMHDALIPTPAGMLPGQFEGACKPCDPQQAPGACYAAC